MDITVTRLKLLLCIKELEFILILLIRMPIFSLYRQNSSKTTTGRRGCPFS